MNKYDYFFIIFLLVFNTSVFSQPDEEETTNRLSGINSPVKTDDCEWCKRTVVVYALSYTTPEFTHAYAARWLSGIFSDNCVTIKAYGEEPEPEYVLSVRFEKDPDGKFERLHPAGTYHPIQGMGGGEIRRSVMAVALFMVDGNPTPRHIPNRGFSAGLIDVETFVPSFLESWYAEDSGMNLEKIMSLLEPQLRREKPLKNMLWDFEQTPVSCIVNPSKKIVGPGEEIEMEVTGFKDMKGRKPAINTVNRVLAKADKGEILNLDCQPSVADPKLMVWAYDLGTKDMITIKYKAPNTTCTEDIVKVWNSCEVRWDPPVPFPETKIRDEIGRTTVKTTCTKPWSGTVMYERNISWKDRQPTEYGYVEFTRQLSERATLYLTFGYTHTYTDTEGSEEYYDNLIQAQGTYNCTLKSIEYIVDEKNGHWNKIEETATNSGNLEDIGGFITVNPCTEKYNLNLDFSSPEITGTSIITADGGVHNESTFTYTINGYGTEFEGDIKEKKIAGSWNLPAGKNQVITGDTGNVPGAEFNWSIGR